MDNLETLNALLELLDMTKEADELASDVEKSEPSDCFARIAKS